VNKEEQLNARRSASSYAQFSQPDRRTLAYDCELVLCQGAIEETGKQNRWKGHARFVPRHLFPLKGRRLKEGEVPHICLIAPSIVSVKPIRASAFHCISYERAWFGSSYCFI